MQRVPRKAIIQFTIIIPRKDIAREINSGNVLLLFFFCFPLKIEAAIFLPMISERHMLDASSDTLEDVIQHPLYRIKIPRAYHNLAIKLALMQ